MLLVGTKSDMKNDPKYKDKAITKEQGDSMAKKIKAQKYMECSAKTRDGVKAVFDEAIYIAVCPPVPQKKGCNLL